MVDLFSNRGTYIYRSHLQSFFFSLSVPFHNYAVDVKTKLTKEMKIILNMEKKWQRLQNTLFSNL